MKIAKSVDIVLKIIEDIEERGQPITLGLTRREEDGYWQITTDMPLLVENEWWEEYSEDGKIDPAELKAVSERGIRLVTQKADDHDMLTVEDHIKWYNLYILRKDGTVEPVPWSNEILHDGWRDHCILPEAFVELAKDLNLRYDMPTLLRVVHHYKQSIE